MSPFDYQIFRSREVVATGTVEAKSKAEAFGVVKEKEPATDFEPDAYYTVRIDGEIESVAGEEFYAVATAKPEPPSTTGNRFLDELPGGAVGLPGVSAVTDVNGNTYVVSTTGYAIALESAEAGNPVLVHFDSPDAELGIPVRMLADDMITVGERVRVLPGGKKVAPLARH